MGWLQTLAAIVIAVTETVSHPLVARGQTRPKATIAIPLPNPSLPKVLEFRWNQERLLEVLTAIEQQQ